MKLIYAYTRQQAIEDGVLLRFEDYVRGEGGLFGPEYVEVELEMIRIKEARFPLGELVITPGAGASLHFIDARSCLMRHQLGDWGELDEEDRLANEHALRENLRLFSAYNVEDKRVDGSKVRIYVITEWNREATTLLLPEDY